MRYCYRFKDFLKALFRILNPINKLIYKNEKKIVLYSNLGFRDNVKAVFDYLIENKYNSEYTIVCSTNDVKNYKNYNIQNVIFTNNYYGLFHYLTSKYFFYCFGKYPIKPTKKQVVINLWHGTPLKKIGNLEDGKEKVDYNYFTYVLATSDAFKEIMMKAFNCSEENVVICGHPRNDMLFKRQDNNLLKNQEKLVVWLPTFRKSDIMSIDNSTSTNTIPIFNGKKSMQLLNDYLISNSMHLIIKLHPIQTTEGLDYDKYSNIEILTSEDLYKRKIELYQLLSIADALITDYSSVYFDYLLLDRPIGFTIDDLELYNKNRGLIFDKPTEYMPGFKIKTKEQFIEFLDSVVMGVDVYKQEREKVNNFANFYKDGLNCRRVLEIAGIKDSGVVK